MTDEKQQTKEPERDQKNQTQERSAPKEAAKEQDRQLEEGTESPA